MSWSRRTCLGLPLALLACGYTPVYGPGRVGQTPLQRFAFKDPVTGDEYLLLQQLERRLGREAAADYRLDYAVSLTSEELAISVSGARTRYNLVGRVTFTVVDTASGQVVLSDSIENFASYSAAGTTIATFSAEQDARERLMVTLGNQIVARLLATDFA